VGGRGIVVCARLLLFAGSNDERLLARLKMSDAMSLGRWRGFKLHEGRKRFLVMLPRPSCNWMIAFTTAYAAAALS
jgi:hypothetical protein